MRAQGGPWALDLGRPVLLLPRFQHAWLGLNDEYCTALHNSHRVSCLNEDWLFRSVSPLITRSGFLLRRRVSAGAVAAAAGMIGRMKGRVEVRMGRSFGCRPGMFGTVVVVADVGVVEQEGDIVAAGVASSVVVVVEWFAVVAAVGMVEVFAVQVAVVAAVAAAVGIEVVVLELLVVAGHTE